MRRPRKLGTKNATLLACNRVRCFAKKVLASIAPYTFISHTNISIFFRKGRPLNYILQSQPGKLMLETFRGITTEPIASGFCCYLRTFAPIVLRISSAHAIHWADACHVMHFKRAHRVETQQDIELMTLICVNLMCEYICWMLGDLHFFSADNFLFWFFPL